MKNIKLIFFIVLIILAVSCKKKKAMNPIILQDYELNFMLNLYPSNPSTIADATVDDDTPSILEVRVNDEDGTVYTYDYFELTNSITVKETTTVDIVIQAKDPGDRIYLGGYIVDSIEDYSPISNGMYKYSFAVGGNTSFIIGVDSDNDNPLVNYNAYKLINRGRGMSDMYVITNFDGRTVTDDAFAKYRVARKSSATITLPKNDKYSLVLEAIPDTGYNLQYWTPYSGYDDDPVITGGVSGNSSLLVYVEPNLIGNDYFIEDPLVLVAEFSLYPGWSGTEEVEEPTRSGISSYEVSLASHIAWIAQKVENGLDFKYYTFSLISDIDMNNVPFSGIASGTRRRFNATFNGNGYAITNLLLEFTDGSKAENAGFIGSLGQYGSVSNLTIATNSVVKSIGGNNLGAVVGYNDGGKVFYCTNYASIDANGMGYNVGGVVGYNYKGELFGLHNAGVVTNGGRSIGGVVGYSTGLISGSYNTGIVEGLYDVGGIVGMLGGVALSRSYNAGVVIATSNAGGVVGSIAINGGQIVNSYNIGDVEANTTGAGGILGYSYGGAITIDKVLSLGIIKGNTAGGLVGGLSSTTIVGTGSGEGLLNMYFLKDTTINDTLDNSGLEDIPSSMSSLKTTARNTATFSSGTTVFNTFSGFTGADKGNWQYTGNGNAGVYNIPLVNCITERFILDGLGEGEKVRN